MGGTATFCGNFSTNYKKPTSMHNQATIGSNSNRILALSQAVKRRNSPAKHISKSLESLPSLSLGEKRQRVVRRQNSLTAIENQLGLAHQQNKPQDSFSTSNGWSLPKIQGFRETHCPQTDIKAMGSWLLQAEGDVRADNFSFLPPLPAGSLIFQEAMRDVYSDSSSDSSETCSDSGSEADDSGRLCGRRNRRSPKLAWYGPLVEYKGQHIYLSTLTNIYITLGRYGNRQWR
ncbi:hypothetical protein PoB_001368700 [Plakobranchus ocellatus]|uniref:Uncharacterized protein n=1 Tax=Plakobranchus ocellatus TaxID=259542 RepID=A0AAV3YW29_9GAST|nr:hypothetical protein PoB_001368700 [Plakobranchus ocellatus]